MKHLIDPSKPEEKFPYEKCYSISCGACKFKETCKKYHKYHEIHPLPVVEEGAGISSDAMAILCGLGVFIAGILIGSFFIIII